MPLLRGPLDRGKAALLVRAAGVGVALLSVASGSMGALVSLGLPWPYSLGAPASLLLAVGGVAAALRWLRGRLRLLSVLPGRCRALHMHRPLREVTCFEGGTLYCVDLASGAAYRVRVRRGPLETRRVSPLDPVPYYCVALLRGKLGGDGSMEGLLEVFWEPGGVIAVVEGRAEPLRYE